MDTPQILAFVLTAAGLKRIPQAEMLAMASAAGSRPWHELLVERGWLRPGEVRQLDALAREALRLSRRDLRALASLVGAEDAYTALYGTALPEQAPDLNLTTPMVSDAFAGEILTPGELLDEYPGRYTLISQQGAGGMGRVYLVYDVSTGRDVALKELMRDEEGESHPDTPIRETTRLAARFLQEARITAKLEHPAIVPVYELGRRGNGQLYYTMRLVRGNTLEQAITTCKNIQERLALLSNFRDLCYAVAFAHSRGVIHRDIKPTNIMVGEFGETVVLDWGIAKIKRAADLFADALHQVPQDISANEEAWLHTELGEAVGTPQYMSPEQARGEIEEVDERSDVYSLGVVLYQIVSGESPFRSPSLQEILRRVWHGDYTPLHEATPEAPPELASIARKAMALNPEDRYPSARALAQDIERWQAGLLVQAYEYRFRELARRYYRRNRTYVHMAALSAALVLLVAAGSFLNILAARREEARQRGVAEREAYLAQIRLAEQHLEDNNFAAVKATLAHTQPAMRGWEWGYLAAACAQDRRTIEVADGYVFTAAYVPNSDHVYTAATDGHITTWDAATGARLQQWTYLPGSIRGSEVMPNGLTAYVALTDNTVRRLGLDHGTERTVFTGHRTPVNDVAVAPGEQRGISGAADGTVLLWDVATGKQMTQLGRHLTEIREVEISAAGDRGASWSSDDVVRLWNLDDQTAVATRPGKWPQFSADGALLALIDGNAAQLIDAKDGTVLHTLTGHSDALTRLEFSTDGAFLVTASGDGTVRLWDSTSGEMRGIYDLDSPVRTAAVSPDGAQVLAISTLGAIRVWRVADRAILMNGRGHEAALSTGAFDGTGRHFMTAAHDGTVKIWDATSPMNYRRAGRAAAPATDGGLDVNGGRVATLHTDGTVRVTDVTSGVETISWFMHAPHGGAETAFSYDGNMLAFVPDHRTPVLASLEDGAIRCRLPYHEGYVQAITMHPARNVVATGGWDDAVVVADAETGALIRRLTDAHDTVNALAFSPAGHLLAAGTRDGEVLVWAWESGELQNRFAGQGELMQVAFRPDGRQILAGGGRQKALLWDLETSEPVQAMSAHRPHLGAGAFNRAGTRFATLGYDGTARLWDAITGEQLVSVPSEGRRMYMAGFTLNDSTLVTLDDSDPGPGIHVWTGLDGAQIAANDEAALKRALAEFRDMRAAMPASQTEPGPRYPITSQRGAQAALLRLMEYAPGLATAPEILPGAMAHGLGPFGMQPGMRFLGIGGVSAKDVAGIRDVCSAYINARLQGAPPEIHVEDQGLPLTLRPIILAVEPDRVVLTLSHDAARQALLSLINFFGSGNEGLTQINRRYWRTLTGGESSYRPPAAGVWLNGPLKHEDKKPFLTLGLAPGDFVSTMAGVPVRDQRTLRDALATARRLVDEEPARAEFTIETARGVLQEREVVIQVSP